MRSARDNPLWKVLSTMALSLGAFAHFASAYEAIEVTDGGTIAGTVQFTGDPPTPAKLEITKDVEVCGKTEKVEESLLVGPNKGIKNVVVSITDIQKGKPLRNGAVLDQKDCVYTPHVVLSPVNVPLRILNSDGILHNVHTHSTKNPPFNRAQPKFRKEMTETFAHPEVIKVTCDAHGWMSGWLVIQEHPYYTVTDETGAFQLTDVPAGDYRLKFWHETLGEVTQPVSVKPTETTTVTVTMGPK